MVGRVTPSRWPSSVPVSGPCVASKIGLAMKQQTWHRANDEGLSATQGQS
jgi:hypothetical protein